MKVKQVLIIAAVLLAMFIVPAAADSQSETTTVSYSSDATFTIIYPADGVTLDTTTDSVTGPAGIRMETIAPGSLVKLSISSGDDGFVLKHAYDSTYTLDYQVLDGTTELNNGDLIITADAGIMDAQEKSLSFSVNTENLQAAGAYEDTLTFTAEYIASPYVRSQAEAQAALDNAVPGTTIRLAPGVNYGTLYLRPSANDGVTKVVDWQGNNYHYETYSLFEEVTIIGAPGAIVDAIEIEGGTYYNTEHSQLDTYPVMLSLIELKNVVIDGVTFTGNGGYDPQGHGNAINLAGSNIKVDGLTLKNCVMQDSNNNNRLLYKTEATTTVHTYTYGGGSSTFSPTLKDITVTGCTLNGGYMGLELRETENVIITGNTFYVGDRNILLPVNSGCTYSGEITITGNTANNAKERFVRISGAGDATITITGNTINNYLAEDADYIKIDGSTGTVNTVPNTITDGTGQNRDLSVNVVPVNNP